MTDMRQSTRPGGRDGSLRVLLAHDDRFELYGLVRALSDDDIELVGEAHTPEQVRPLVTRSQPDVLLASPAIVEQDDFALLRSLRKRAPGLRVIILRGAGHEARTRAACAEGACGFISTSADPRHLAALVSEAALGHICVLPEPEPEPEESVLTDRELSVLRGAARGLSNEAIGQELWLSSHTVKSHLHRIYTKLGVANRTEAARWALENQVLEHEFV